jgi:hypothetical protein
MNITSFFPFTEDQTVLSNSIISFILAIWLISTIYMIWKEMRIRTYFKKQTVDAILNDKNRKSLKFRIRKL